MATIKIKLRPSATQGSEGTLFFQVIHRRVTRTVSTDYHVNTDEWDDALSAVRMGGSPGRQAYLQMVASKIRWNMKQFTAILVEKETAGVQYTADDVVEAYRRMPPCQTWFGFIRSMADRKIMAGRHGTAKTYSDALKSFSAFRSGEDIVLDALDGDTIVMYEAWLRYRGLKRNSSSCYMRTLRTLYRKAVGMGLTTDKDIFRHVFTGFAKTAKRAIPLASIRSIRQLELPEGSRIAFARDVFMLSIYLQGMSFVDMAYLRKSDISSGQLQYNRKKTGQCITVSWEPSMQAIVDEYAHLTGGSPYLLPIITRLDGTERRQYVKMEHNVNRLLKKIGAMAGVRIPLTTYVARHSWATTMRDMGYDLSIVSRGLGHESLKTTQIYLSTIDTSAVANANRRMIGRIIR
ncbi:site-specific recombinase phage integrase family [Prevotella sp. CAG:1058]|nr:site-specific recombinase phage integrase family [Prevotella sp. CAG:1058]